MSRTYDDTGNITRMSASDGTDFQYTYDALNRLLTADTLSLTYDARGGIINSEDSGAAFSAGYDDGERLKSAGYDSAFTVTYSYDATTGLLSRVADDLTGTQLEFAYDPDRRLAGISRPNAVNTEMTWDSAGRITRIQEGQIIDIRYTIDRAGQVIQISQTVPLDPDTVLPATGEDSFIYDAASQMNTTGYTYDARGRLVGSPGQSYTWDDASRLTGIGDVLLTYNGLDDLASRSDSGNTRRFHYNYAFGLAALVAEQDPSTGQFLRYYVWTPGGTLLYMIDASDNNKVYFYHFDRTGSTLALTDASGGVTDLYAYTPYGKLLEHQGSSGQPFTFCGRWGVRQEGTHYQMGVRYYDADSARFLSREPLWPRIESPEDINPYQYAGLNPLSYVDPNGMEKLPTAGDLLTFLVGEWSTRIEQELFLMEWEQYLNSQSQGEPWVNHAGFRDTVVKVSSQGPGNATPLFDGMGGLDTPSENAPDCQPCIDDKLDGLLNKGNDGGKPSEQSEDAKLAQELLKETAEKTIEKAAEKLEEKAAKKAARKKASKKARKRVTNKVLRRTVYKKAAKKGLFKLITKGNVLAEGGASVYELGSYAVAATKGPGEAGKLMKDTITYQVVKKVDKVPYVRAPVRWIGKGMSWLCGD
jgi:RHS repeat-associated protein